jgi:hypothetical protein
MKILEYNDLDTSKVKRQYQKIVSCLENDDFYSAEVKKLGVHDLYRAKLDDSNRLIFKIVSYGGVRYALLLEVVLNHAYEKSKFLRGVPIDEAKIPVLDRARAEKEEVPSLIYVNPSSRRFHLLDKVISFDPEQQDIYNHSTPLIIIGPAGSGKTALTLEKMKHFHGQVLYVTLSPYLADNSRNIYYAHHYENDAQEISFLSFSEFIETMKVPEGREIKYSVFASWIMRFPKQQRVADAHRLYEEFRGVITGSVVNKPWLSREEYLGLGVRQSIYLDSERELVYSLFEKYLSFLRDNGYYDPNILAHGYLKHVQRTYDFVVVDEVQDITNIQLQLILGSLKVSDNFMLCGDSNQIVHPNFFSWSSLKSMLYNAEALEARKVMRVLQSNFRNSADVTNLSNKLLRIKQKRFGSVDRESNYLMNSLSENAGEIIFMKDTDKGKTELNRKIRRSTRFALLVMRDEDKPEVRKFFDTPLLFSIQEAKGLEYENVVLLNFISSERVIFRELINGIGPEDLTGALEYMRSGDKRDKSLEVYKFFVNSLYVAVTRAVQRLYLIESDTGHPLIELLGVRNAQDDVNVEVRQSTVEEWQAEARKLELQGRQEQADDIRRDILKTRPVPWDVCTPEQVMNFMARAMDKHEISQKPKKTLYEYGLFYGDCLLLELLCEHGFNSAKNFFNFQYGHRSLNHQMLEQQRAQLLVRHLRGYTGKFYRDVMNNCEVYGPDHRTVFNKTPLMLAALAGNGMLLKDLLSAGADTELTDNYGLTAWQGALQRAAQDATYASASFSAVHEILAPSSVSLKADDRLVKLDSLQGEFLIFHIFLVELHRRLNRKYSAFVTLTAPELSEIVSLLPDSILPDYRKKRAYISALLSKNEVNGSNPYCKQLFKRKRTGKYVLNPKLAIRRKEDWTDIYSRANIELVSNIGSRVDEFFPSVIRSLLSDEDVSGF